MPFLKALKERGVARVVIVGALGYFVDIYDLVLFSIVRVPSLKALGVPQESLLEVGVYLLNMQMAGMLLGGIFWGILGDKRGRISVLFGSIVLYSLANIANAFVTDVSTYGLLRFLAGIGLAGELGAAVTLVSEVMSKETRGLGTTVITTVGVLGAVVAALVGDLFSWQVAYVVGGCLGLALLALRVGILESKIFDQAKKAGLSRGSFHALFSSRERLVKYLSCIFVGIPIWFVVGILVTFSPEIARELEVTGPISAGDAIMYAYIGLVVGDFASGYLSQVLRSRKKAIFVFLVMTVLSILVYASLHGLSPTQFYAVCVLLGISAGYWAVFVTTAAEQFGTNIRATVTTTAPNFVRGAVVLLTSVFQFLKQDFSLLSSALIVGGTSIVVALIALSTLKDSFGKDLDYLEEV